MGTRAGDGVLRVEEGLVRKPVLVFPQYACVISKLLRAPACKHASAPVALQLFCEQFRLVIAIRPAVFYAHAQTHAYTHLQGVDSMDPHCPQSRAWRAYTRVFCEPSSHGTRACCASALLVPETANRPQSVIRKMHAHTCQPRYLHPEVRLQRVRWIHKIAEQGNQRHDNFNTRPT